MTNVGKVNKNNLQQKQSSCLAPLSPAVSAVYISLFGKYAQHTFEAGYSLLTAHHLLTKRSFHVSRLTFHVNA